MIYVIYNGEMKGFLWFVYCGSKCLLYIRFFYIYTTLEFFLYDTAVLQSFVERNTIFKFFEESDFSSIQKSCSRCSSLYNPSFTHFLRYKNLITTSRPTESQVGSQDEKRTSLSTKKNKFKWYNDPKIT